MATPNSHITSGATEVPNAAAGRLGTLQITLLAMAAAAPLAVVAGSAASIAFANGAGTPLNFVALALVLLLFAVGYTALQSRVKPVGGFFDLIARGLGAAWATGGAYASVVLYLSFGVACGGFFGIALEGALGAAGIVWLPWWGYALIGLAIITVLTYLKVNISAKIVGLIVVLELIIVTIVSVAVVAKGGATGAGVGFTSFTLEAFGAGSIAVGLALNAGAFVGFESTSMFRRDARDPERTVPRATYLTIVVIGVCYALGVWLQIEAWGAEAAPAVAGELGVAMYSVTAGEFVGVWAALAVGILLCTSIIASVTVTSTLGARYINTLSTHGLLPRGLAASGESQGHPVRAITLVVSIMWAANVLWIVTGIDPLQILGLMTALSGTSLMMVLALVSAAVIVFFRKSGETTSRWKGMIAPGLSFVCFAVIVVMMLMNFSALSGTPDPVANTILALVPVAIITIGWGVGNSRSASLDLQRVSSELGHAEQG